MVGPLMFGISADPVAAAKVLNDFAKSNDKFVIKAGAMPNQVMDANAVKALATMPSREELLSKLLGTMQAPIAKFVRTLKRCLQALCAVWLRCAIKRLRNAGLTFNIIFIRSI